MASALPAAQELALVVRQAYFSGTRDRTWNCEVFRTASEQAVLRCKVVEASSVGVRTCQCWLDTAASEPVLFGRCPVD